MAKNVMITHSSVCCLETLGGECGLSVGDDILLLLIISIIFLR